MFATLESMIEKMTATTVSLLCCKYSDIIINYHTSYDYKFLLLKLILIPAMVFYSYNSAMLNISSARTM